MRPPLARGAWDRVRLGLEACACILVALVSLPQHGFAQAAADPSEAPTSVPGQVQRLSETRRQFTLTPLPPQAPVQTTPGATVPPAAEAAPTVTAMPVDPLDPTEQQPAEGQVQRLSETRKQITLTPLPAPTPGQTASGATVPLAAEAAPTATAMPADPFGPKEQQPAEGQVQQLSETRTQIPVTPSPPPAPGQATAAATADTPATAAVPPDSRPSEKNARKADKLYLQGAKLLDAADCQGAYQAFSAATQLDPSNQQYAAAREVARQHFITQLVQEAVKARLAGHPDVSRQKLEEALLLDPKNPIIAQHVEELANDKKMAIDQVDTNGVDADGPIVLTPASIKKSFHLKSTQQDVLKQVLSAYEIAPVMDSSVPQQQVRLDADDVDFTQASQMAKMLTGTFFVPLDPKRVLVAKDTKENRTKFERLLVESVYVPGVTSAEMTEIANVAKNVFEAPVATAQPTSGILTVRAPQKQMKALNATLEELLDGKSQVMLEVRLFDLNRVRMTDLGVELPPQMTVFNVESEINSLVNGNQAAIEQIIASGLAAPGDYGAILGILIATGQITSSILTEGFATFGGGITQFGLVPGTVTANASLNSSDTRVLDEIHLRVQDREEATFKVGERYPIVTSTVSSGGSALSASGINTAGLSSTLAGLGYNASSLSANVTIPQIQYQDLGLTLKATPWVQHGAEVFIKMDLEFTALGGTTLNGNPILNNRKYTAAITLKDGASAMVVSSLSKQETKAVIGIPGISELPGLRSTTDDSKNFNESTLLILVTPHIVRRTHTDVAGREFIMPLHQ